MEQKTQIEAIEVQLNLMSRWSKNRNHFTMQQVAKQLTASKQKRTLKRRKRLKKSRAVF